jgi:hypothetical protein
VPNIDRALADSAASSSERVLRVIVGESSSAAVARQYSHGTIPEA